jgi:divalent metal cation (Fe/Co/Zn/Cd) transporter
VRVSARREVIAHRIVVVGLITVGLATIAIDVRRLVIGTGGKASLAAIGLATVSLLVLTILSIRKRSIARRVSSAALRADGHLSSVGAAMAAITLGATALTQLFGWHWADATAAIIVGGIAVLLGVQSTLDDRRVRRSRDSRITTEG